MSTFGTRILEDGPSKSAVMSGRMNGLSAAPGLVIVDSSLRLMATNTEAVKILTFPQFPEKIPQLDRWLANKVRSELVAPRSTRPSAFVPEFRSARRMYLCRSFPLKITLTSSVVGSPASIILLERKESEGISTAELCERFGLTPREQQTVQALLQGLTSKEIAERMKISPNTVKAFIRLVMLKMNVSTRSGIIGKLLEPNL